MQVIGGSFWLCAVGIQEGQKNPMLGHPPMETSMLYIFSAWEPFGIHSPGQANVGQGALL